MSKKIGLYKEKTCKGVQWRVRWFGQYDPNTGKQRRYGKTFALRKDAERFAKSKDNEFDDGGPRDPSTETLQDYCQWWLQYRAKGQALRPATIDLYQRTIGRLCDYFGGSTLLRQITPQNAEQFFDELHPLKVDKVLTTWSRHQILRQCKTLFADAEDRKFIARNPFKKLRGPKTSLTAWYYLNPSEYRAILDATPSLREQALYALCYTGGLRLSEAVALRWADVDFASGQVQVVSYAGTETLPPFDIKDYEQRTIPLPTQTIELLLRLHGEAPEKVPYVLLTEARYHQVVAKWQAYQAAGRAWRNRDYANNVLTRFKQRVRRAGIRPGGKSLTVHTLRKCACQNWIQAGLPINVVQMLMGHANIATTAKHYTQVTEEQRRQVSAAVSAQLQTPRDPADNMTDRKMTFSADFPCQQGGTEQ